ncbi:hypothetical protein [Palleronia abyssalis]|uniref:Uncharacterized protein n=1 Tax=Palleronia abyssalis TaxID=1501240 RepID=A0A2R8BRT9_9RHOB|nr:hypothetical protein [Palleronia abyssalis]SPJ22879.1 hypothetical protein PAA8504_00678 [Palleronia abyssalis]
MRYFFLSLLLMGTPALAEDFCRAEVNDTEILIDRDTVDADRPGLRESLRRWPTGGIDRLRGREPVCDSQTLIAFLASEVPEAQIDGYCLANDPEAGFLLVPGARDYRGRCTATTCDLVNAARDGAGGVAGTAADLVIGRGEDQSRTDAVIHASGAAILSGSAASILGTLGTGASTAMTAALAAPAVAGAAAVSVVAIGGAVYLCSGE